MRRSIRTPVLLWSFAPYAALSIVHVIALAVASPMAGPTKLFLMPLLLVPVAVTSRELRPRAAVVLLIAAVGFSWFGDGAAAFFPFAPELPTMLLFFGLAHVAYMVLFVRHVRVRRVPFWALAYGAWWIVMIGVLAPHVGGLLIAVAAYGLVLGGTAALSAACRPTIAWGGAFFLASDSILAFRLFLPEWMPTWTSPAVMATYTLGQGLLVAGLVWSLAHSREPAAEASSLRA